MAERKTIQYAIHRNDGLVVSRVGSELGYPVLQYDKIGLDGDFRGPIEYSLEKIAVTAAVSDWPYLVWTRFVPVAIKNRHRAFWGMPPLADEVFPMTLKDLCRDHKVTRYWYDRSANTFAVYHGTFGAQPGLYHWFKRDDEGRFRVIGVTDDPGDGVLCRIGRDRAPQNTCTPA